MYMGHFKFKRLSPVGRYQNSDEFIYCSSLHCSCIIYMIFVIFINKNSVDEIVLVGIYNTEEKFNYNKLQIVELQIDININFCNNRYEFLIHFFYNL